MGIALLLLGGCSAPDKTPAAERDGPPRATTAQHTAPDTGLHGATRAPEAVGDTGAAAYLSDVTSFAVPPEVAKVCDSVAAVAARGVQLTIARADGAFADSFQGTRRGGCRLYAGGVPTVADSLDVNSTLFQALEQRGWSADLRYGADGPDGASIGLRHLAILCLIGAHGAGRDDDTTTGPPDLSITLIIECTRDVSDNADAGVPDSIWSAASAAGLDSIYAIDLRMQYPPYTEGDFDGDGVGDAAILVQQRRTGKLGVAFVMGRLRRVVIAGAGTAVPGGSDDFGWANTWDVGMQLLDSSMLRKLLANGPFAGDVLRLSHDKARYVFLYWKAQGFVAFSP